MATNSTMSELVDDDIRIMMSSQRGMDLQKRRGWDVNNFYHNYVDELTEEIVKASKELSVSSNDSDLILSVVKYYLKSNCITDAVDLCLEVSQLDFLAQTLERIPGDITDYVDKIANYLTSSALFLSDSDDLPLYQMAIKLYMNQEMWIKALILIVKIGEYNLLGKLFYNCSDVGILLQASFILARHSVYNCQTDTILEEIMSRRWLFNSLGFCLKEFDQLKAIDIRQMTHLSPIASRIENPRCPRRKTRSMRLKSLFIANGLANCGAGSDALLLTHFNLRRFKIKYGTDTLCTLISSIGLIHLWNADGSYEFYRQLESESGNQIQAGLCMATLLMRSSIRCENDLLSRFNLNDIHDKNWEYQISIVIALGIAHVGSENEEAINLLQDVLINSQIPLIVKGLAGLSIGLIVVGSANCYCARLLLECLLEIDCLIQCPENLVTSWFLCLAIGLCFLAQKRVNYKNELKMQLNCLQSDGLRDLLNLICMICSFAGSGDVLKVQQLLHSVLFNKSGSQSTDSGGAGTSGTRNLDQRSGSSDSDLEFEQIAHFLFDPIGFIMREPRTRINRHTNTTETIDSIDLIRSSLLNRERDHSVDKEDVGSISEWPCENLISSISIIGIAIIASGEVISREMASRILQKILITTNCPGKEMVPLAYAILYTSNPDPVIMDILEKIAKNESVSTSLNAIIACGLIGGGTLNGKVVRMLKSVVQHYENGPSYVLNAAILSSGLLHLGRGLLGLHPFNCDGKLLIHNSFAALLIISFACIDVESMILGKLHQLIFYLTPAIQPRWILTLNENTLEPIKVNLRVGKNIQTSDQFGQAKIAADNHVYTSPAVLNVGEKAEIVDDDHIQSLTPFVEDVVLVRK